MAWLLAVVVRPLLRQRLLAAPASLALLLAAAA
jgi:hypothetical protein